MSVILDALKRVQEENRRRAVAPERMQVRHDHEGSALLRRLRASVSAGGAHSTEAARQEPPPGSFGQRAAAPSRAPDGGPAGTAFARAPRTEGAAVAGGVRLSPPTWAALGLLVVTSAVALLLWWMQPELAQRRAPERPLLQELSAGSPPAAAYPAGGRVAPAGAGTQEFESFGGGVGVGAGTSPDGSTDGFAAQGPAGPYGARGDAPLSDLTAALPPATGASAGAGEGRAAGGAEQADGGQQGGVLKLEVEERPAADAAPAANAGAGGELRISSERGTASRRPAADATGVTGSGAPAGGFTTAGGTPPTSSAPLVNPYLPRRQADAGGADAGEEARTGEQGGRTRLPEGLVDPGVRAAFREGVRLHKAGDLAGAEQAYKRALKFDPRNARVNANLGVLYERLGRLALAERYLRQAVAVEPDNANARNNLGVVLYRQGNYEAALTEFNRTLELDPRRVDAYTNKGLIFTRWGDYEKAQRAFLQVLAIEPDNALAHYNLGLVYEQMEQIDKALEHYDRFLALGASDYPEIASYLSSHLEWLEAGRGGGRGRIRGR